MIWIGVVLALGFGSAVALRWGTRWGSTTGERALSMPGDEYLDGERSARVIMTRAISIAAPPERVWPWIAQFGRGAGWYSIDRLDNGGKTSARHIVSWIPEPALGDATATGYLRSIDPGHSLVWWVDGVRFLGARARLVIALGLVPEPQGTRLVGRYSADAAGVTAHLALLAFRAVDSVMARRQFLGIRHRVEAAEAAPSTIPDPETGARDQYQLFEVLYADGSCAGKTGAEQAALWRQAAIDDGVLERDA